MNVNTNARSSAELMRDSLLCAAAGIAEIARGDYERAVALLNRGEELAYEAGVARLRERLAERELPAAIRRHAREGST